jgi:endonuclease G
MRFLILLSLFSSLSEAYSQNLRDSVFVKTQAYEVIYSEKLEQPRKLTYSVACTAGDFSRSGMNFYLNDTIKTSDDLDYVNNVYDKGHLAPAANFNCDLEMMNLSFSYLNCALQHQALNRGVWKSLESHEREMFLEEDILVVVQLVFSDTSKVLPTGATVPDGFYKTITTKTTGRTYIYYFPNRAPENKDFRTYLIVPSSDKEKRRGIRYIKNK